MILKPSSIDLFLDNVLFIRKEQENWRRREETISSRANKKTTDISQRLYFLHHQGTLKISVARELDKQKSDMPSETYKVEPRDPTNSQLASYHYGVSKLRDELMRTKEIENRSNSYTLPQDLTDRQLSLYKTGVSKLRNELKKCKSHDIPSSMGIYKISSRRCISSDAHSTSRAQRQVSKVSIENLSRKLQEALKKRQHLNSDEIQMQAKRKTDTQNGQHLLEIDLRHAVLQELQNEWKFLKEKKALSRDESEVLHRDDVKIPERSMATKQLPSTE